MPPPMGGILVTPTPTIRKELAAIDARRFPADLISGGPRGSEPSLQASGRSAIKTRGTMHWMAF